MATRGTWKITKFKHTGDDKSVKIPVTFTYFGHSKTIDVTGEEQDIVLDMPWETEFGTKINIGKIDCSGEKVVDNKKYVVTNKNLNAITLDLRVTTPIEATETSISYTAISDASVTAKYGSETKTSSSGSFTVPANTGQIPKKYVISAFCVDYPEIIKDAKEITQKGTIPHTISAYTGTTGIETAATIESGASSFVGRVITENQGWRVSSKDSWLTVTPSSSQSIGTTNITVEATENPSTSERAGNIIFAGEIEGNKTIKVTQKKKEEGYHFDVTPLSLFFVSGGSSSAITIDDPNGYNWEITNLPTWLTASTTGGNSSEQVTITAEPNDNLTPNRGWFYVKETSLGETQKQITVIQEAKEDRPSTAITTEITINGIQSRNVIMHLTAKTLTEKDYDWTFSKTNNRLSTIIESQVYEVGDTPFKFQLAFDWIDGRPTGGENVSVDINYGGYTKTLPNTSMADTYTFETVVQASLQKFNINVNLLSV